MIAELSRNALLTRIVLTLLANTALAGVAYWRRSVSLSGACTGFVLGSMIYLGGGFAAWGVLLMFFISSSVLSRFGSAKKIGLEELHEKGHTRDGWQAFANAGVGALAMLWYAIFGQPWALFAFTGSMAAATADTWSSELGVLAGQPPRSILTFRSVEPGTSGGVSVAGTLASAAGAAAIFLAAIPLIFRTAGAGALLPSLFAVLAGGLGGSLIDSLLGAGLQALYRDGRGRLTERPVGELIRGLPWMNNDAVNLISNAAGSALCTALAAFAYSLW